METGDLSCTVAGPCFVPRLSVTRCGCHLAAGWCSWQVSLPQGTEAAATVPLFTTWTVWWNADRALHFWQGYWDAPIFHPTPDTFAFSEPLATTLVVAPLLWLSGNRILAHNAFLLLASGVQWLGGISLAVPTCERKACIRARRCFHRCAADGVSRTGCPATCPLVRHPLDASQPASTGDAPGGCLGGVARRGICVHLPHVLLLWPVPQRAVDSRCRAGCWAGN